MVKDYKRKNCILIDTPVPTDNNKLLYFDLRPAQKCYSKVIHRKEVTHSNGQ